MTSINGLRTYFQYHVSPPVGKKPDIDIWLKQISVYDLDCMIFCYVYGKLQRYNPLILPMP